MNLKKCCNHINQDIIKNSRVKMVPAFNEILLRGINSSNKQFVRVIFKIIQKTLRVTLQNHQSFMNTLTPIKNENNSKSYPFRHFEDFSFGFHRQCCCFFFCVSSKSGSSSEQN